MIFESKKHPGLYVNRWGVVFAKRGDPRGHTELYRCVDWQHVPIKTHVDDWPEGGRVRDAVIDELETSGEFKRVRRGFLDYEYIRTRRANA